ncbi:hypothetical protein AAUPMG_01928 [Pasteurella multocida subsp. multocida str. Anand1_goat]|nr:hypothetical protein AAUPMG_01928 [Pasteurella multocida subsp. multocida str. Anand1_goat]
MAHYTVFYSKIHTKCAFFITDSFCLAWMKKETINTIFNKNLKLDKDQ